jgi:hypothetical protein
MREDLEKLLAGESGHSAGHPAECAECREDLAAMKEQAAWLRDLREPDPGSPSATDGPRTGFYARVMERIEAQSPSIWNLFFESQLGRRLAIASMAIALCLGVYLVSSDSAPEQTFAPVPEVRIGAQPASMLAGMPDENSVLVNLITYREQ